MLKNKIKLILTIFVSFAMMFTYSISFAVDAEETDEIEASEEAFLEDNYEDFDDDYDDYDIESDTEDENSVDSDLYLIQDEVNIDYNIDGNVYIIAKTVNITSEIGGDAFIIADTINLDDGYIYNNLFALANTININGIVYDLYAGADTITIGENGYVYRDAHSASDTLNIFGTIRRNVTAAFTNIAFTSGEENSTSSGTIYGDLNYYSSSEATIDEYSVEGTITFNEQTMEGQFGNNILSYLEDAATYVATAVLIYLLVLWLTPKLRAESKNMLKQKILPVIGFGLLGLFATPVAIVILMILGITVKFAFALLGLYVALLIIASSIAVIGLTEIIAEKMEVDNKWKTLGLVACVAVAIWAIELIPVLGGLVSFATVVLGLGLIIKYSLPVKKVKESNEDNPASVNEIK